MCEQILPLGPDTIGKQQAAANTVVVLGVRRCLYVAIGDASVANPKRVERRPPVVIVGKRRERVRAQIVRSPVRAVRGAIEQHARPPGMRSNGIVHVGSGLQLEAAGASGDLRAARREGAEHLNRRRLDCRDVASAAPSQLHSRLDVSPPAPGASGRNPHRRVERGCAERSFLEVVIADAQAFSRALLGRDGRPERVVGGQLHGETAGGKPR